MPNLAHRSSPSVAGVCPSIAGARGVSFLGARSEVEPGGSTPDLSCGHFEHRDEGLVGGLQPFDQLGALLDTEGDVPFDTVALAFCC